MQIKLLKDGIIIVPETECEATYLRSVDCENIDIFRVCGQLTTDYIGRNI